MKILSMKKTIVLLLMTVALCSAQAQGTFRFTVNLSGLNEVPPNSSPYDGSGVFDWDGTTLTGGIQIFSPAPRPTGVFVHGPADVTSTAPILFELGFQFFEAPFPPDRGGWVYGGSISNLTSSQISDLFADKWYVETTSTTFPNGELRGQIVPVPEPSSVVLLSMGLAGAYLLRRRV